MFQNGLYYLISYICRITFPFFLNSLLIFVVSQGGSDLRTLIDLFGICLSVRAVILSVIFSA